MHVLEERHACKLAVLGIVQLSETRFYREYPKWGLWSSYEESIFRAELEKCMSPRKSQRKKKV